MRQLTTAADSSLGFRVRRRVGSTQNTTGHVPTRISGKGLDKLWTVGVFSGLQSNNKVRHRVPLPFERLRLGVTN